MGNKERVAYALLFGDRFILRYYFFFLSRLDEYYIPQSIVAERFLYTGIRIKNSTSSYTKRLCTNSLDLLKRKLKRERKKKREETSKIRNPIL